MQYIKQLDSIRAFAVILVIISHWFPYHYVKILRFGNVGVEIFFVLSGFLITRILLNSREKSETFGKSKIEILKNFIARRSLRIFPIYYILLVFLFIFAKSTTNIENDLFYYVSYTSNWLFL
jgi:peptidoglycan/LPS O-acetylase OafA/YrhL